MKSLFARRVVALASTLGAVTVALAGGVTPAHAVLPSDQVAVAAAGSDTSEKLMNQMTGNLNNSSVQVDAVAKTAKTFNIPAYPTNPASSPPNTFTVPGDTNCTDVTWARDPGAPAAANANPPKGTAPFGSTAGRNYLSTESSAATDAGCVDVARSSSAPRNYNAAAPTDKSTFEYYAFAMDAVGWATTSLKAPSTLTRAQLAAIYDCTITNWDQVGGQTGDIQRYLPQAGSGTRSFFLTDILGKSSSYVPPVASAVPGCPTDSKNIEENEGQQVASEDIDKALLPYSGALWAYHAQNGINPTIDRRNGARMGGITTSAATPLKSSVVAWISDNTQYELNPATVVESNIKQFNPSFGGGANTGEFPGIRYIYNVIDNAGNLPGYQAAFQLFGFKNSNTGTPFRSKTCDARPGGAGAAIFSMILSNGFASLPATAHATYNIPGTTCRFFPPPSS